VNLQEFDGRNTAWALYAARLAGRAYSPFNTDGLAAAFEEVCGLNPEISFRNIENSVPATIKGKGPDGLCVACSGVTGFLQGKYLWDSYEALLVNSSTNFYASYVYECAVQLVRQLQLARDAVDRDVFIFGHSLGGAIAIALASLLRPLNPRHDMHVVTFGSPRPGAQSAFNGLARVNLTRYMNIGDDVPRLPPRLLDLTDLSFLAVVDKLPFWSRFVHPFGGLALDALGNVSPADVAMPTSLLSITTFPINYLSQAALFGSPHSIAEYCRRLSLGLPPKIPGVLPTLKGSFDVGSLPIMFEALRSDIPMSLPIPIQGGVELETPPAVLELQISRREAFLQEPIKRC